MKLFVAVLLAMFTSLASFAQDGGVSLITIRADGGTNDGGVTLTNIVIGSTTEVLVTSGDLTVSPSGRVAIHDQPGIRVVMEEVFTNYTSTSVSMGETLDIRFNRGTNTEFTLERSSSLSEPVWSTFGDGEILSVTTELGPSSHVDYVVWHINLSTVGANTVYRVRATSIGPTYTFNEDDGGEPPPITITLPLDLGD